MLNFIFYGAMIIPVFMGYGLALQTPVSECSGHPLPLEIIINDCTAQPCPLVKNQYAVLNFTFRANKYLDELLPKVTATVAGLDLPYDIDQKDACLGLTDARCPLEENEIANYVLAMKIHWYYPSISLTLTFSLVDKDEEGVVCFKVDCYVTN